MQPIYNTKQFCRLFMHKGWLRVKVIFHVIAYLWHEYMIFKIELYTFILTRGGGNYDPGWALSSKQFFTIQHVSDGACCLRQPLILLDLWSCSTIILQRIWRSGIYTQNPWLVHRHNMSYLTRMKGNGYQGDMPYTLVSLVNMGYIDSMGYCKEDVTPVR